MHLRTMCMQPPQLCKMYMYEYMILQIYKFYCLRAQVLVEKLGAPDAAAEKSIAPKRKDHEAHPEPVCDYYASKCVRVWGCVLVYALYACSPFFYVSSSFLRGP